MGSRGPVPKRSEQRRRANKPEGGELTKAAGAEVVEVPEPDPEWHPVARRWFESLAASGQSHFYEPSDWASAYLLAESMSRELSPQPMVVGKGPDAHVEMYDLPPKGASLAAWRAGMAALLVTEADRRRALLELQRPQPGEQEGDADVADLARYRERIPPAG